MAGKDGPGGGVYTSSIYLKANLLIKCGRTGIQSIRFEVDVEDEKLIEVVYIGDKLPHSVSAVWSKTGEAGEFTGGAVAGKLNII